jgi:hypothetical protein
MAKNYLHTYTILDERKGKICAFHELTSSHLNHQRYIHRFIRPAVKAANCGWSDVQYICIKYPDSDHIYPYMVLCVNDKPERWIPVDGNSDGCNLQVIGENLW